MAGADDLMLPVPRVEMVTDEIRHIKHARPGGSLRAAAAGPLNAGLIRQVGLDYRGQAEPVDWLLTTATWPGTIAVTTTREEARMARGGVVLFPLGAGFTLDGHSAAGATLRIPLEAAAGLAEEYTGLVAQEMTRMAASALLATFPNTAMTISYPSTDSQPPLHSATDRGTKGRPPWLP